MDTCYYSIIERGEDGYEAWVPDLPGVTGFGATEEEALQRVFAGARECLRNLIVSGEPLPEARAVEDLPEPRTRRSFRRLLLVIS